DVPERRRGVDVQLNVLADQFQEQRLEVEDDLVEVDPLRLHHLLATEGEELPRQGGGPIRGTLDLVDVLPAGIAQVEAVEQQIRVAEDGGQHVIEIVRSEEHTSEL